MNAYATLGVHQAADKETIKAAFRKLISKAHPDKGGSAEEAQRLNEAYTLLMDDEARAHYDATGQTKKPDEEAFLRGELAKLALATLDQMHNIEQFNLVDSMRNVLKRNKGQAEGSIQQISNKILKLRKAIMRLDVKEGEHNLLHDVLNADVAKGEEMVEQIRKSVTQLDQLEEMLKDYTYRTDPMAPSTGTTFGGTSANFFTSL